MKPFVLEKDMLTMRGVFYPTGYVFLMFPDRDTANQAGQLLLHNGFDGDSVSLLTPEVIQEQVARTVGNSDIPLPSAGTEADTVRKYAEFASQGHYALMVRAPKAEQSERVMNLLKDAPISYGQKYRQLVIEDLV